MAADISKSKRFELTISETPEALAGIIASAMNAIIAIDESDRIVLFNAAAERMFSCTASEAIGDSIERFISQHFRSEFAAEASSWAMSHNLGHLGKLWALRATGEEIPIEASISEVESGGKKFITVFIRDISEHQRAEDALRESEQRFRFVADTAPVLIWMAGTDKLCTYFNKPWLDFTGRSIEAEHGNGWSEGVHPEDLQRCLDKYTKSFDRREKFRMEYRLQRHDGEYRWVLDLGVPRFNPDGSFAGYIGIAVDVTERKIVEQKLRESEERFRLAAQAGKMFAYEWDAATDVIVRSPESAQILGVDERAPLSGQQAMARVHPDDRERLLVAMAALSPENPNLNVIYRIVRPDETVIWVERQSRAHFNEQGNLLRIVGMVANITERQRAEEKLADMTRKLVEGEEQVRARIARELHDDINQRLALLAVELGQLQDNPSGVTSRLKQLEREVNEISNSVQALSHDLHSSKLEHLGAVNGLKSWCREYGERQRMEIDFRTEITTVLPHEIGVCLFRVLQEATHNVEKHSGVRRIEVRLREDSVGVHLVVSDLGKGFDIERAMQGNGLGLTSMRERVRLVNGTIQIHSKPMGGTTIHVTLPFSSDPDFQRVAS